MDNEITWDSLSEFYKRAYAYWLTLQPFDPVNNWHRWLGDQIPAISQELQQK